MRLMIKNSTYKLLLAPSRLRIPQYAAIAARTNTKNLYSLKQVGKPEKWTVLEIVYHDETLSHRYETITWLCSTLTESNTFPRNRRTLPSITSSNNKRHRQNTIHPSRQQWWRWWWTSLDEDKTLHLYRCVPCTTHQRWRRQTLTTANSWPTLISILFANSFS